MRGGLFGCGRLVGSALLALRGLLDLSSISEAKIRVLFPTVLRLFIMMRIVGMLVFSRLFNNFSLK